MTKTESMIINEKYKQDRLIKREEEKRLKLIEKRKVSLERKKQLAIEKAKSSIWSKYKKQLARFEKQQRKRLEKKTREILWQRALKRNEEIETIAHMKKRVFKNFQRCIRFDSKDINQMVVPVDKPYEKFSWKSVDAGHFFSKHNNPHLIFDVDNVRPQTKWSNKMQLDWDGTWWQELLKRAGKVRYDKLMKKQANKKLKFDTLKLMENRWYWEKLDEKWKRERKKREKWHEYVRLKS